MAVYDTGSPYIHEYYGQNAIRLYYGVYTVKNIPYRIGDTTTTVRDESEKYYDTWNDFHLVPTERPNISLPKPNTKTVNIPGRKDPINFTSYLTGHVTFGNRSGSWTFFVDNDFVRKKGGWIAFDQELRSKIHGHVFKVVLKDDPGYFYAGQINFGQWSTGNDRSSVTMSYNLYPYKKSIQSSMDQWKFDDFDFNNGIIQYLKDMEVNNVRTVKVYGSPERISPHISGTSGLTVEKYENNTWISYGSVPTGSIDKQSTIIPRFIIDNGENQIRFRGNGTVTIDYRRGLL